MCVSVLLGMCITCMPGAHAAQKRTVAALGLEAVVSHRLGASDGTWVLCKNNS